MKSCETDPRVGDLEDDRAVGPGAFGNTNVNSLISIVIGMVLTAVWAAPRLRARNQHDLAQDCERG